jgi:hypothetical protein
MDRAPHNGAPVDPGFVEPEGSFLSVERDINKASDLIRSGSVTTLGIDPRKLVGLNAKVDRNRAVRRAPPFSRTRYCIFHK